MSAVAKIPQAASARPLENLRRNLNFVLVGQESTVELVLMALVAHGHVLLEDVPGTGKTVLVKALSRSVMGVFRRIQCTADLLPSDVTGVSIFNQKAGTFEFQHGPIFANIVLADEINRASPRTQSALLEAMAEGQVTSDSITRDLPRPHFILATQNHLDMHGTYPLPRAQLDRFWLLLNMNHLRGDGLTRVLTEREHRDPLDQLRPVVTTDNLITLQEQCVEVTISDKLVSYVVSLAETIAADRAVVQAPSTRAILHLQRLAQASALLNGRRHVLPDDVKHLLQPALAHRFAVKPGDRTTSDVLADAVRAVAIPIK